MMTRCSSVLFLAGHYAMRSPMCLRQLRQAVDHKIPIVVANCFAGVMPDFMEEALQNASTFVDFVPSFMPQTIERGQASFENSFTELVNVMRMQEQHYVNALPEKMTSMIGQDADAFALEQVDGKFFVLMSHGGVHRYVLFVCGGMVVWWCGGVVLMGVWVLFVYSNDLTCLFVF